jgi:hypothetical protein
VDAVEWVEIVTLVALVLLVVPIYRYLGAYTRLLIDHRKAISNQGDILEANRTAVATLAIKLDTLNEFVQGEAQVVDSALAKVNANAKDLQALREGITALASSFTTLRMILDTDDSTGPNVSDSPSP